ncbi:MAG: inositol monophosphatase family protein [Fervidicoccus fontis]
MSNFDLNYEELMNISRKIAEEASKELAKISQDERSFEHLYKGKETIKADKLSEDLIIEMLKNEGIRGTIVTEESEVIKEGNENIIAIIDPLDGSKNYARGIKWCSVSIAFAEQRGNGINDIVAGTVKPVFFNESFSFYKRGGVFVNNERYYIKKQPGIDKEKYYAVYFDNDNAIETVKNIREKLINRGYIATFRSLGSAALELALVSIGKIDGFIDARSKLRIVDAAAGIGMIIENGGVVRGLDGEDFLDIDLKKMYRFKSLIALSSIEEARTVFG